MVLSDPHVNGTLASIATIAIGIVFGLMGIIYRSLVRRMEKAESLFDMIIEIRAGVKHILKHCVRCPESEGNNELL